MLNVRQKEEYSKLKKEYLECVNQFKELEITYEALKQIVNEKGSIGTGLQKELDENQKNYAELAMRTKKLKSMIKKFAETIDE